MISINSSIVEDLIIFFNVDIEKHINELKNNLIGLLFDISVTEKWHVEYINKIIDNSADIITASPSRLDTLKGEFDKIVTTQKISSITVKPFRDKLLTSIGYVDHRKDFYPKYFQKLGIKSCVYCNSQLTVSIDSENNGQPDVKAKFQVDHYWPKSEYPCFSISLFNLYPVCASCNNVKRVHAIEFELYTADNKKLSKSIFKFKLNDGCVADYKLCRNQEVLDFKFMEPEKINSNSKSFQETFDIEGIYKTQKDIVEELINKSEVYPKSYRVSLIKSFPDIFTSNSLSNRFIVGNYTDPKEIHKRPMSKFTQDIARQLKLI